MNSVLRGLRELAFERRRFFLSPSEDETGGAGTFEYPFDCSSADRLDQVLRGLPEFSDVIFLPGDYRSRGFGNGDPRGQRGFRVRRGWRIRGSGMGNTRIKLGGLRHAGRRADFMADLWERLQRRV